METLPTTEEEAPPPEPEFIYVKVELCKQYLIYTPGHSIISMLNTGWPPKSIELGGVAFLILD